MIYSIHDINNNTILVENKISFLYITGYIYGIPMKLEVGVNPLDNDIRIFKVGEKYKFHTKLNQTLELVLAHITMGSKRVQKSKDSLLVFMPENIYQLHNNLFLPSSKPFGISLEKHIIGSNNQLEVLVLEMRKKGLIFTLDNTGDEAFAIKIKHNSEYQTMPPKFITNGINTQIINQQRVKQNYSSIEEDGSVAQTRRGASRPIYIPAIKKQDIYGLNTLLEPMYIVQSRDDDLGLSIGVCVAHQDSNYCIIEQSLFWSKSKFIASYTLGALPNES